MNNVEIVETILTDLIEFCCVRVKFLFVWLQESSDTVRTDFRSDNCSLTARAVVAGRKRFCGRSFSVGTPTTIILL